MKAINKLINGPAGKIECSIEVPENTYRQVVGIICHPHPLYEGTMQNKVVSTLARAFLRLGAVAIRFNFRGVGKSEGEHDYSVGELEDLRAVIRWAKQQYPNFRVMLAGFSFGSYIATRVAADEKPLALVSIAPAVHHQDYKTLPKINFPWIVVQGEVDEVVPPEKVFSWLETLEPRPTIIRVPEGSHFFHGQLVLLRDLLVEKLEPVIATL